MENKSYLMLCKKKVTDSSGKSFYVVFGYRQTQDDKGEYHDVLSSIIDKEGQQQFVARSVKVALGETLRKKLDAEDKYPYRLTLDSEFKLPDGRDSYYVTINKDKDGKVRLDNNGNQHAIVVIRDVVAYEAVPLKSLTLDDIDNINDLTLSNLI